PLILTTGRVRDQWHTMTRTGKVSKLNQHIPEPFLEMHPTDARPRMLEDGQLAVINSRRGAVRVKLKITEDIRPGVVFLPMHWGKVLQGDLARANNLTETRIDPVSKQPDFKFTPVTVKAYKKRTEKICVIGAGAAAYRWVQSYREQNRKDPIHVFSQEAFPFYNRVLLPEYATDHLNWADLQKLREGELTRLQIELHAGVKVQEIIREKKVIVDQHGQHHKYDKLILATGSRAYIPREVPLHIPGIFSMRNRGDADRLKAYLQGTGLPERDQHVTIVGGGLLGLEMAAALRKQGLRITLIQRSARLMERQLDPVAAKLLADAVQDMGIQVHFSNEVSTIFQGETPNEMIITLKSGKILTAHALIYCVGTRPNIELAQAAGLKCGRGIQVNEYLQSSDSDIFAIGEIAAFKERQYGITDAAEQQADSLARYMAGDLMATYQGSVSMN
ncbi:MAG: FAD-dependent oxidoreductase, partial [Bacteroidota bacterium]